MTLKRGILPFVGPLPRFNLSQPGNTLRVFEKGGVNPPELGNPSPEEINGAPERALSARGFGTLLRTDPVFLGLQKTRLNDPLLGFLGTNDHPGDYRSSGCTACHTVYANDRSPTNSGWYSKYGNQGLSFSGDPTMNKKERGHPISHQFTRSIPSSQCMNCHMHQGNLFVNPTSATPGGTRKATASSCTRRSSTTRPTRNWSKTSASTPRPPPRAGCGKTSTSSKKSPS